MKALHISLACAAALMCTMCAPAPKVPEQAKTANTTVAIYPDYDGVTIPVNIAPLNFAVTDTTVAMDRCVAHVHAPGQKGIVAAGPTFGFDPKAWRQLLADNQGDTLLVDIYTRDSDGAWTRHLPMRWAVAEEIDPYISYRKIEPSYIGFEQLQICQRHLESFDESEIFNNCILTEDENGQCINCHSYQDYNRGGNMQMHVRVNHGGTVIAHNGKLQKVNLKTPETISGGVYPSWHPTLPLIAYSVNKTTQNFHENHKNKVEVQDSKSDILLYEVDKNKLHIIEAEPGELETFPYWNHDGTALYYVSAQIPVIENDDEMRQFKARAYKSFKYNIYRKPFDAATLTFGPTDTVYMASAEGYSATFPRESRDGRFLLFTRAPYGTFHIWHKDADLMLLDLQSGEMRPLDEVNSRDVESYHSFSSNGRWIIFSSRREDGSYTRLYMAHFGEDGRCGKPFLLPQRDPMQNKHLYKSYNIPEFMAEPVGITRAELIDAVLADALPADLAAPTGALDAPSDTTETYIY